MSHNLFSLVHQFLRSFLRSFAYSFFRLFVNRRLADYLVVHFIFRSLVLPFDPSVKVQIFCVLRFPFTDGIFTIKPHGQSEVKTFCDFTTEGGPWTLLVTSKSHSGWDKNNIKQRNPEKPSLQHDFSILGLADAIKDFDKSKVIHC